MLLSQAQKKKKKKKENYPPLIFNSASVQSAAGQKHSGLILDFKFDFYDHIDNKINKISVIKSQT